MTHKSSAMDTQSTSSLRVAFGCTRRVGKDTSCSILSKKYPNSVILSFAEPLYSIMKYVQGVCGVEQCKDRKLLQLIGTHARENYGQDIWANILRTKVNHFGAEKHIFVSDVRYPNEARVLREMGFTLVKLERSTEYDNDIDSHSSEAGLDDSLFDFIIQNNGTLAELEETLLSIL